jgi:hypothetical protein
MILDDGGDATMAVYRGAEFERLGEVPEPEHAGSVEFGASLAAAQDAARRPDEVDAHGRRIRRHRRDHDRRAPPHQMHQQARFSGQRSTSTTP